MVPHATFEEASSRNGNDCGPSTKRKATAITHESIVKRRKYDFNHAPRDNENDDVIDSVDWSPWPLHRSLFRSPQQGFDAEDSSYGEDDRGVIKDSAARGIDIGAGTKIRIEVEPFLSKRPPNTVVRRPGSTCHRNLTSQLAEELQHRDSKPSNQISVRSHNKTLDLQLNSDDIEMNQEAANIPAQQSHRIPTPLCNTHHPIWHAENQSAVSSPLPNDATWPAKQPRPDSAHSRTSNVVSECPSDTTSGFYSPEPPDICHRSSDTPTNPGSTSGLGFPLHRFRAAFEEERLRWRMGDVVVRMGALTLRDGVMVER
ncbi:hypothetical protein J1614_009687 [Plenodomus biglobosus]|nr:hypothetical protein J1614_009687 [Plenodomus biglobosus]